MARLDGGTITSDAGGLILREVDAALGLIRRLSGCFTDKRDPDLIEHTASELLAQRIFALALGYEDLNDHDTLRRDPLLATLAGKLDPTGASRSRQRDKGAARSRRRITQRSIFSWKTPWRAVLIQWQTRQYSPVLAMVRNPG